MLLTNPMLQNVSWDLSKSHQRALLRLKQTVIKLKVGGE